MSDWQPIETMPRTGTYLVYWSKSIRGTPQVDIVSASEYRDILQFGEPPATHWMPLPDPPREAR